MPESQPARVRIAPSPTGRFHIGNARTALYDFLLARQTGGQFVLRIEDTDRKRFDPDAEREIKDSLRWLGLDWDEGPDVGGPHAPYRQSERVDIYHQHAQQLIDSGHAYYCFCSPERLAEVRKQQQQRKEPPHYDGLCRRLDPAEAAAKASSEPHVIRFKTPHEGTTTAVDMLRDPITVENSTIDDYVLVKSDGLPVYHLAALVDDHLMEITHVMRGSEWLGTFPLHVLIYQAFGWAQPNWVHLSVFLNPSGKGKLSKRHGQQGANAIFVTDLRQLGYIPEAVNNWMALMGWSFDDHTEYFPMDKLIQDFSLDKLKANPAAVNYGKLDHFNGLYIRQLAVNDLAARIQPYFEAAGLQADLGTLARIAPIIQERIRTLDEAVDMAGFFFKTAIEPDTGALVPKGLTPAEAAAAARAALGVIEHTPYEAEPLEAALRTLADNLGLSAGQLFTLLREAVTGQHVSPPLLETMEIVGKATVVERIEHAAYLLETQPGEVGR
jgi:glutamyl-tRNA synthetase